MSLFHENQPLIRKTFHHVRDLDQYGREAAEAIGDDPNNTLIRYMDQDLDMYLIDGQFDPTRHVHAFVDRMPVSGGKERLYLSRSMGLTSLAGNIRWRSGVSNTRYLAGLDTYEHIPADDPRLNERFMPDSARYYKIAREALREEYEQAFGKILALTPDNLYREEISPPTPGQERQLHERSRTSLIDLYAAHDVDALTSSKPRTLSFKVGDDQSFSNVTLRLRPGVSESRTAVDNDPLVSAAFEHDGAAMYALLPLGENTLMHQSISLTGDSRVRFDSYAELSYLVDLVETLAQNADHAILDYCDNDHVVYEIEYALQPVVKEDSSQHESLVDFMKRRRK